MTSTIPTDPEAYDLAAIKAELQLIRALEPKLALYEAREFRELPPQLQQEVRALKSITQPTASGLEHVESLLWQLASVTQLLERLASGQSIADQLNALNTPLPDALITMGPSANAAAIPQNTTPASDKQSDNPSTMGTLSMPAEPQAAQPATAPAASSGGTLSLPSESANGKQRTANGLIQGTAGAGTLVLPDEVANPSTRLGVNSDAGDTASSGTLVLDDPDARA